MAGVLRDLQSRVGTVTKGFYHLYKEFQVVRSLFSIAPNLRTRAEHELIRTHTAALKKVGVVFVLQLVPIVGYVPIFAAVAYPKTILTAHFWSPEQRLTFLGLDYETRKASGQQLLSNMLIMRNGNSSPGSYSSVSSIGSPSLQLWSKLLQIDNLIDKLDRQHFSLLTTNNVITEFPVIQNIAPIIHLKHWLNLRVLEIVEDDVKLVKEGIKDLTNTELQDASIRRGFNPLLDENLLRRNLDLWLGEQFRNRERQSILQEQKTSDNMINSTALLHLIAHNSAIVTPILK